MVCIIKNEDDDGWVVEMVKDGEFEFVFVGLWIMGCDKKNLKLMDVNVFCMFVKIVIEVLMWYEQQWCVMLYKEVMVQDEVGQDVLVIFDIVLDEFELYVQFKVVDLYGELLVDVKVLVGFKFNKVSVECWVVLGFEWLV